jgi:acid phosphatase class B
MTSGDDNDQGGKKLQDFVKNAVTTGLSAVFLTEDSIRSFIREKKLPTEWASELVNNAQKRKDELMGLVGREMSKFFQHIDVQKEITEFLRNHNMRITANVTFHPREERQNQEVKHGRGNKSRQDT